MFCSFYFATKTFFPLWIELEQLSLWLALLPYFFDMCLHFLQEKQASPATHHHSVLNTFELFIFENHIVSPINLCLCKWNENKWQQMHDMQWHGGGTLHFIWRSPCPFPSLHLLYLALLFQNLKACSMNPFTIRCLLHGSCHVRQGIQNNKEFLISTAVDFTRKFTISGVCYILWMLNSCTISLQNVHIWPDIRSKHFIFPVGFCVCLTKMRFLFSHWMRFHLFNQIRWAIGVNASFVHVQYLLFISECPPTESQNVRKPKTNSGQNETAFQNEMRILSTFAPERHASFIGVLTKCYCFFQWLQNEKASGWSSMAIIQTVKVHSFEFRSSIEYPHIQNYYATCTQIFYKNFTNNCWIVCTVDLLAYVGNILSWW